MTLLLSFVTKWWKAAGLHKAKFSESEANEQINNLFIRPSQPWRLHQATFFNFLLLCFFAVCMCKNVSCFSPTPALWTWIYMYIYNIYSCVEVKVFPSSQSLTSSLPQPVQVPGWKVYTYTPADSIFDGPVTNLLSILCILIEVLSRAHAEGGKPSWFQIRYFYWVMVWQAWQWKG